MWGTADEHKKVLIAIGLRAEDNEVDVFTFPFESTTEEFYNLMLNEWREEHEVPFPEGFSQLSRPLSAVDSLLPDNLKVDRMDIIQRAQTEWHFVVLSNRLYQSFHAELQEIAEKLKNSDNYSNHLWEEMKQTWERIQKNIFDKTLMRDHGQELREMTNDIFTQLKNMRKSLDSETDKVSAEFAAVFNDKLDSVEEKIKGGLGLQPLFNDLKRLQKEFKEAQLSRGDRSKIWKRIDNAFKAVKEKRFGEKSTRDSSTLDRLNRRYSGLMAAIDKMQKSINRDNKDKSFQDNRIANTEGQLEAQIRMAKIKMIEERVNSKNEKLEEMLKTKGELESRIEREKKFQEEQQQEKQRKEEIKEAKETVKQKIAESITEQADQVDAESLEKAAQAIAEQKAKSAKKKPKESMFDAIRETVGESLTDLSDSIGAVASVVGDHLEESFKEGKEEAGEKAHELKEKAKHFAEGLKEKASHFAEDMKEKASHLDETLGFSDKTKDKLHHLKEDADATMGDIGDAVEELKKETKQKAHDLKETAKHVAADLKEKADHLAEEVKEKATHLDETLSLSDETKAKLDHLREEAEEKMKDLGEAFEELKTGAREKLDSIQESAKHLAEEVKEKFDQMTSEVADSDAEKKDDNVS